MKKLVYSLVAGFGGCASILCITAARHQDTIRPNTKVGPVIVGGKTPEEAARALRVWWESEKLKKLTLTCSATKVKLPEMKPSELGVTLDDAASVAGLPMQTFSQEASAAITQSTYAEETHPLVWKTNGASLKDLETKIAGAAGPLSPARVVWVKGALVRKPEVTGIALDSAGVPDAVEKALSSGDGKVELPVKSADKHVPDAALASIKELVSEFSTRFSAGNRPRCANIKLAASKINGVVLMPGDRFSFNGVVGRRTLKGGFKLAGVYVNGQHDTGVGGGICQVSTTLYNSALFADLKIHSRSNHSLPVPYVPLGRDATVDYGNLDLVFENTYPTPIALTSVYEPGRLTFRIFGQKQPGLSVKISQDRVVSRANPVRKVTDRTLPLGRVKVIEPGSIGRSVHTFRYVYQDGKLVRKERLGSSYYGGKTRIIAVGAAVPLPKPILPPTPTPTAPQTAAPVALPPTN